MKSLFSLRKRAFLNPVSTGQTSHVLVEVESSHDGEYRWGTNMLTIADCRRRVQLEFFLGTVRERRISIRKLDLLIGLLMQFREALVKERDLIEKGRSRGTPRTKKT
jgi:hypothetical protein